MNLKFQYNHYVPILKGKAGEFGALANISKEIKQNITPLIDIPPISFSKKEDVKRLDKITNDMITSWGVGSPFFIDILAIKTAKQESSGSHPLTYIFQHIKSKLYPFSPIPTTGLIRDDDYNEAVAEIISINNSEICIRLFDDDMLNIEELNDDLNDLLIKLATTSSRAHLLLDFRGIFGKNMHDVAKTSTSVINNLSGITKWKTLTLAASGLPQVLGKKNEIVRIPRVEFFLWKQIICDAKKMARVPSYGDYGIVHPNHIELASQRITPSPKIRYTLDEEWLVLKGHSPKKSPNKVQYLDLSKQLIGLAEFKGSPFSKGDKDIKDYASGQIRSGSLTKWIEIDTIHHVTLVSNQIANTVVL